MITRSWRGMHINAFAFGAQLSITRTVYALCRNITAMGTPPDNMAGGIGVMKPFRLAISSILIGDVRTPHGMTMGRSDAARPDFRPIFGFLQPAGIV